MGCHTWFYKPTKQTTKVEHNGVYYEEVESYYDIFRIRSYPKKVLLSKEETLRYITNTEREIVMYEDSVDLLEEFWEKYPNGMITFS